MDKIQINWITIGEVMDFIKSKSASEFIHDAFENAQIGMNRKKELIEKWMKMKGDLTWFASSIEHSERYALYEYLDEVYKY